MVNSDETVTVEGVLVTVSWETGKKSLKVSLYECF